MRPISVSTYVIALVISILLFSVGILIGVQLTQSVNNQLQNDLDSLRTKTTELETLTLLSGDNPQMCGILQKQFKAFDGETTTFGDRLYFLEKNRGKGDATVLKLKLDYTIMQMRDYLLAQKLNNQCNASISIILYFYNNTNCPDCQKQGEIGPQLKRENPAVMIYAFDAGLGSQTVSLLQELYNVTRYPSLIVNNQKLEGYHTLEQIKRILATS